MVDQPHSKRTKSLEAIPYAEQIILSLSGLAAVLKVWCKEEEINRQETVGSIWVSRMNRTGI